MRFRALTVALFAAALLLPAAATAAERTISVSASATLKVPNDTASIGLGVSAERRSRGEALRVASARLRKVIAAVQAIPGVGDGDVRTGRVSVSRVTSRVTPVRGEARAGRSTYRAAAGIAVTLHEPDRAGELIQAAIAAGASGVRGPTFSVGDSEAAYAQALAAAFEKAKAKAAALASQAGGTLGQALQIQEGGEVEPPAFKGPASTEDWTGYAPLPTKPGTSTVTARVGVVFALL